MSSVGLYVVCEWLRLRYLFFFSSRRRHTRCALVTGVQTCALPIYDPVDVVVEGLSRDLLARLPREELGNVAILFIGLGRSRSEERRVGKECVRTCRSRWSPYH